MAEPRYETAHELQQRLGHTDTVVCADCGVFVMDKAAHTRSHAIADALAEAVAAARPAVEQRLAEDSVSFTKEQALLDVDGFTSRTLDAIGAGAATLELGDVKTCGCGEAIFFAMTGNDKPMPVVYGSAGDPAGTLAVWRDGARLRCRVLKKDGQPGLGEVRYRSHFADCPQAGLHRKAR